MIANFERRQAEGDHTANDAMKYLIFSSPEETKQEIELQKYEYVSLETVAKQKFTKGLAIRIPGKSDEPIWLTVALR